ncbi:MAG: FAD:protein FMN transferase [Thermincolia bacterium]
MKKPYLLWLVIFVSIIALLWGSKSLIPVGGKRLDSVTRESRIIMDTLMEITAYGENGSPAVEMAFDEIHRINGLLSRYDSNSEVTKINRFAGIKAVAVSPETFFVINKAVYYANLSEGAFDPTVGPLVDLWAIGTPQARIPPPEEINHVLKLVDFRQIILNEKTATIFLPKAGMELDLGAVAKGYAVGRAVDVLRQNGIATAKIDAGGDIMVMGTKPGGQPWRLGIKHPRGKEKLLATLTAVNENLVTSGDYQRFFMDQGRRYHHIFDPRTGYPVRDLISATIVTGDPLLGDILSTAVFVLGPQKGLALTGEIKGTGVIMVTPEGKVLLSPGLEKRVNLR